MAVLVLALLSVAVVATQRQPSGTGRTAHFEKPVVSQPRPPPRAAAALALPPEGPDVWLDVPGVSNGCDGADAVPVDGNSTVVFVGVRASAAQCQEACAARPQCLSYCYVGRSHAGARAGRCYARTDHVWLPSARPGVYAGCDRTRVEKLGKQFCTGCCSCLYPSCDGSMYGGGGGSLSCIFLNLSIKLEACHRCCHRRL